MGAFENVLQWILHTRRLILFIVEYHKANLKKTKKTTNLQKNKIKKKNSNNNGLNEIFISGSCKYVSLKKGFYLFILFINRLRFEQNKKKT